MPHSEKRRTSQPGRLRIAYVIINYNRREGTSRAIAEVADRLALDHEVHLYASRVEGLDARRIQWHRIPGVRYPHVAEFLSFYLPCARMLDLRAYDIVHAAGAVVTGANVYGIHNIQPAKHKMLRRFVKGASPSLLRRLSHWAYLLTTSAVEMQAYTQQRSAVVEPRLFIPVSRGVCRELTEHYDIGDARVEVIPNGADLEVFRPLKGENRERVRAEFGYTLQDCVLIFTGGEWRRKGLDLAIQALGRIRNERVKLLIMGRDPAQEEFQQMAERIGVADRVQFAGFRSDVHTAYAAADAMLFPSWYEAFSVAMIEAAACGLPIFSTRINGAEEFIIEGENGAFLEPDPGSIAPVLERYIGNPERLRAMGEVGHRMVTENYQWDEVARRTERAYWDLLNNGSSR